MSAYDDHEIPIIVRGEGCYVYDEHGKRYLDGLSALFCVNIGHGRADVAQAGADQAKELGFFTNWSYAHPRAIELAARIAELAPGDLNRVFFTSGGSEAVESAIKLCRQYHKVTGNPLKTKIIARDIAYHGTSLGALAATGITSLRTPFEPLTPGGVPRPQHQHVPHAPRLQRAGARRRRGREDRVRGPRDRGRGHHGAGPERRRLLHPAGGLLAAGARDLRRVQRPAHLRRGHLRLGPPRRVVRRPTLRLRARHHHHRQGADECLRADGRGDRVRQGGRAVHGGHSTASRTDSRSPGTRSARRWPWPTST